MELIVSPVSNYAVQFSRIPPGYGNWQCVNEYPTPDDNTVTYAVGTKHDLFNFSPLSTLIPVGATINSVTIVGRFQMSPYDERETDPETKFRLRVGGTEYNSGSHVATLNWKDESSVWETNPKSGVAWTRDDILNVSANGLQAFGYTGYFSYTNLLYSQVYMIIDYDTTTTGVLKKWSGILTKALRLQKSVSSAFSMSGELSVLKVETRVLYEMGDYLYALIGPKLYKVDKNWTKTLIGTIGTSSGKAFIHGDGTNLAVVDGLKGYSWNGVTFAEISFPDAFAPSFLTYQDGYYIVGKTGTDRFYISSLLDPTTWDALDYASAERHHDALVVGHSHNGDLWLMGNKTLEIWYNSGAQAFPFERYNGGFIPIGCKSARSVVSSDYGLFWLDNRLQVRKGYGIQSEIISTPQIENQIFQEGERADLEYSVAFFYIQKGHAFYVLNLGVFKTLAYDITTGIWHTRTSGVDNRRHPAQCYVFFNNKHIVGHYSRGKLYSFDYGTYTNDGEPFYAVRTAQSLRSDRKQCFHHGLEIEFESGVGPSPAVAATALLEYSDDHGRSWKSAGTTSIGMAGEYTARAIWRRLGKSRDRIYRVTINDSVKRVIIGAHINMEVGEH